RIEVQAQRTLDQDSDALSDDELLAEFDDDPEFERLREARLQQLKDGMLKVRELRAQHHGEYTEILEEKEMVLLPTKSTQPIIAHFYHKDFERCKIMDSHLEKLAPHHFMTRFVKANVERMPFLVDKFGIRILPCVLMFSDSKIVDRLVGFEELGNVDDFKTERLERRLAEKGIIKLSEEQYSTSIDQRRNVFGRTGTTNETRGPSDSDGYESY
ncbi:hypothetical protein EV182_001420, partial [Spiromyces aspiralis]